MAGMGEVTVRVAEELRFFLPAKRRRAAVRLPHDGTASTGHLVESLGVPLTEVGELRADGRPVRPAHRPAAGAEIDVPPVARPQPAPPRFLLDVHLGKLARRMRLLGLDTAYRNDAADDELIAESARDGRVLLTQDRGILRRRAVRAGAYVRGQDPDEQLADVLDRFAPPLAPWTRCTACNHPLTPVSKEDVAAEVRPGTRRTYDHYARCPACLRIYWRGAHSRRIERIIRTARGR